MKKLILLFIPFLMGMTFDEAHTLYHDLNCNATPSTVEGECTKVSCARVTEMATMYVVEWDTGEPPIPPPEPTLPPVPSCIATWCNLPLQSCDLPPLTGGVDSCGQPCSKPSPEFKNCIHTDGSVGPKEGL